VQASSQEAPVEAPWEELWAWEVPEQAAVEAAAPVDSEQVVQALEPASEVLPAPHTPCACGARFPEPSHHRNPLQAWVEAPWEELRAWEVPERAAVAVEAEQQPGMAEIPS
jgi:hypothetical protein